MSNVLYCDDDVAFGSASDIFFVLWRDRTTMGGVNTLREHFNAFSKNRSKDIALVTIVSRRAAKSPPADVRHALAKWLSDASEKLLISAVVFEGDGFVAALVRGIVTGLTLISPPNCSHRVVASVWHAADWFATETLGKKKSFTQDYVMSRVSEFRQQIPETTSFPVRNALSG